MNQTSPAPPDANRTADRLFVSIAVLWIAAAALEPAVAGSFWLLAGFVATLSVAALVIMLRDRNDLARFATQTAAAWDSESKTLMTSPPSYDMVIETDVAPVEVIRAVHCFLQTSDWGAWRLESGDEYCGRYRRGAWVGNPPQAEPTFFTNYVGCHRTPQRYPAADTPATPAAATAHSYPLWPLSWEISVRPTPGKVALKYEIRDAQSLGPALFGIESVTDAEPYRRNRCRLIDYYCRCVVAEADDLAEYLKSALQLPQRPPMQRR